MRAAITLHCIGIRRDDPHVRGALHFFFSRRKQKVGKVGGMTTGSVTAPSGRQPRQRHSRGYNIPAQITHVPVPVRGTRRNSYLATY